MTTTNHLPDQQSPEAALSVSPPSVEWMPLEGLASQWAAFVSLSTRERAFTSARFAFGALEEETAARHMEMGAQQALWPETTRPAALCASLDHLTQATASWLSACEWLEQYRSVDLPSEEEQSEDAVHELLAESYSHLLHLACLSVRLVQEVQTTLDAPVRVLIGRMDVAHLEGMP